MGATRTALKNYVDGLNDNEARFDDLHDKIRSLSKDEVPHLTEFVKGGVDVLLLHLSAKFKKSGSTLKANEKKLLSEVSDPTAEKCIQQINASLDKLSAKLKSGRESISSGLKSIDDAAKDAKTNAAIIKKSVLKKKGAWLLSKEKKAKYKHYLELVEWIEEEIKIQEAAVEDVRNKFKAAKFSQTETFVKNFSIRSNWTVDDLVVKAEKDLALAISDYEDGGEAMLKDVHKVRSEIKKAGPQIKRLKEMASEADDLDGAG